MSKKTDIVMDTKIIRNKIEFFENKFQSNKIFYLYVDYTNDGIPFYVGKGSKKRIQTIKRNNKHIWVSRNYGLNRIVLFADLNEQWIFAKEIQYIKLLDTYNPDVTNRNDLKCNWTLGGDGVSGFLLSEDHRKKLSASSIKRWEKQGEKEKISIATKKAMANPDVLKRLSESHKTYYKNNPEILLIMSERFKKYWKDNPDVRKKQSEIMKQKFSIPENCPNFGKKISKETREKKSKLRKGKYIGEENPGAILTNAQAQTIREEYDSGNISQKELGIKYNVSKTVIYNIVSNITYKQDNYEVIKKSKFKLTDKVRKNIIEEYITEDISQRQLAKKYNVSQRTICCILNHIIKKSKAKLTNEQVQNIRAEYVLDNISQLNLSRKYNVSENTIYNVVNNKTYKNVKEINCKILEKTKKRNCSGENSLSAKFTKEQIINIRSEYCKGKITFKKLAEKYNVSINTINDIINKNTYKLI